MNVLALMDELEQLEIMLLDTDAFGESPVSRRIGAIEALLESQDSPN